MKLRTLPPKKNLKDSVVLVRVDWNVPLNGRADAEASLKFERSIPHLQSLAKRGAKVVLLTHIGRPKRRENGLSARHLIGRLKRTYGLDVSFHPERVSQAKPLKQLQAKMNNAASGTFHLLENVRFEKGEDTNAAALVEAYASLGDMFINDAFASSHRAHASVAGLARKFGSKAFAGPGLAEEVEQLSKLLAKPKHPFVAVIGGKKLSTKVPVLKHLLKVCDAVMIGGAMSVPFYKALGYQIGASFCERDCAKLAKGLVKHRGLFLPADVGVSETPGKGRVRYAGATDIGKRDVVVDVGPATLRAWGALIRQARTIVWNGPLGISEHAPSAFGSRFMARAIGSRAKGSAFGVAGGGDTIPVIRSVHAEGWFDFVSTGGGALLDFLARDGKLPGLVPLMK